MKFSIFNSDEFLRIITETYKLKKIFISGVGLNFYKKSTLKTNSVFFLPFCFYQTSDYFIEKDISNIWGKFREYSSKNKINIAINSIGLLPLPGGKQVANNPILDLKKVDQSLSYCFKNHRQNILKERNKAIRFGVKFQKAQDDCDLEDFYDVLAGQYVKSHRMVFQPIDLYRKLINSGLADLYLAKINNAVIGGVFCIKDGDVYHYSWGARVMYKNMSIGTYLIDQVIDVAASQGFKYFDFGSTPLSDSELFNYKMKWGCINHQVFQYTTLKEKNTIDLNDIAPFARLIFSKIPIPLAKKLMPFIVPFLVY